MDTCLVAPVPYASLLWCLSYPCSSGSGGHILQWSPGLHIHTMPSAWVLLLAPAQLAAGFMFGEAERNLSVFTGKECSSVIPDELHP